MSGACSTEARDTDMPQPQWSGAEEARGGWQQRMEGGVDSCMGGERITQPGQPPHLARYFSSTMNCVAASSCASTTSTSPSRGSFAADAAPTSRAGATWQ